MTDQRGLVWRAYWPMAVLAVTFLAVVVVFSAYVEGRQHAADARAEKQRRAICAILANIPGHIPPEIVRARAVFARPRHPNDCQLIGRPAGNRAPTPTPAPTATVVIVRPTGAQPTATATVTASPHPSPRPSPTATPTPTLTPSPSRTCCPILCI